MTAVGSGGVRFDGYDRTVRFEKEYKKLDSQIRDRVRGKIIDLLKQPFPPGLAFEKLKGYSNPDLYTFHVTGNYKVSLEVKRIATTEGRTKTVAVLRRIAPHNEIDRAP
jgi:mRNA-degrading endonuclease RelE of RelBE toxin-antitoxin system